MRYFHDKKYTAYYCFSATLPFGTINSIFLDRVTNSQATLVVFPLQGFTKVKIILKQVLLVCII